MSLILAAATLTGCQGSGGGAFAKDRAQAIGAESKLGKTLLASQWCTEANGDAESGRTFSTLELRQNATYVITQYSVFGDNALKPLDRVKGTWALLADQIFMRTKGVETHAKVLLSRATNDGGLSKLSSAADGSTATSTSTASPTAMPTTIENENLCLSLTTPEQSVQNYCTCAIH